MPVAICSSAASIAPPMRSASPLRRAPASSIRSPASCCSVSSCSSRAQRVRSASEASIPRRSASSLAFCAVATAVAALAANACSSRSSSSLNGRSRSKTIRKPTGRLRKAIGVTIAARAPSVRAAKKSDGMRSKRSWRPVRSASDASDSPTGSRVPLKPSTPCAGDRGDHELVAVEQRDLGRARVDQRPRALDHELQDTVEVGHAAEREADLGRRLQAADRALELLVAGVHRAVQPGVGDRDRRPVGEHDHRLLVLRGERAVVLLGQVEVPPRLALDQQRHAEERPHRRVRDREAVGPRVRAHVVQAQRMRVGDQHAEHAAPARGVADRPVGLLVDPGGDEALEPLAALVEHADRRVPGAGQLARDVEQPLQERLGVEHGDERAPDLDQPPEPVIVHVEDSMDARRASRSRPDDRGHRRRPHGRPPGPAAADRQRGGPAGDRRGGHRARRRAAHPGAPADRPRARPQHARRLEPGGDPAPVHGDRDRRADDAGRPGVRPPGAAVGRARLRLEGSRRRGAAAGDPQRRGRRHLPQPAPRRPPRHRAGRPRPTISPSARSRCCG